MHIWEDYKATCIHTDNVCESKCGADPSSLHPPFPDRWLLIWPHLSRYEYELQASTAGGTGVSEKYVLQTPASCPGGVQPPHRVTVSGPRSVSLGWKPPGE